MVPIMLLTAPIRRIANSRLFQLAVVFTIILLLDHYSYDYGALLPIAEGLKKSVTGTVELFSKYFGVGILTDPVLQVGLMIAYVYVVCLLIFFLLRRATRWLVDVIGWSNFLWLRSTIARERGIAAYRAWEPLEKIRPADCPQPQWEQQFAWPADNKPPYALRSTTTTPTESRHPVAPLPRATRLTPPLPRRLLLSPILVLLVIAFGVWAYFGFPSPDTLASLSSAKQDCVDFAEKHKDQLFFGGSDQTIQAVDSWMKNGKIVVEIGAFKNNSDAFLPRICVVGNGRIEIVSVLESAAWR
jgi:hypothetical protein